MAICSPYEPPHFITAADEADVIIGTAVKQANESGVYTKDRVGSLADMKARGDAIARDILPFNFEKVLEYFKKEGWITAKADPEGKPFYKAAPKLTAEDIGAVLRATKTYLMSTAVGTRQMASNFLLKVKNGEDALNEGLAFAKQMQHTSRFGGLILGWDQTVGLNVASQGGIGRAARVTEAAATATEEEVARLGNYTDIFQSIAEKMNNPDSLNEGINDLIGLARKVEFLEDPVQIARVSAGIKIAGRAWEELFKNGLLSGPATFAANAAGIGWAVVRPVIEWGAAAGYSALGLPGAKTARQVAVEAAAAIGSQHAAWGDAWQLAKRAFNSESSLYGASYQPGISGDAANEFLAERGMAALDDGFASTLDALGGVVRWPGRALLATDEMAKHIVIRGEIASRAMKKAAMDGVELGDKAKWNEYLEAEMGKAFELNRPGDPAMKGQLNSLYELDNGIMKEAESATFQEDNAWAKRISGALEVPVIGPALKPMIPFVRTPLNILKQGFYESTGLGALWETGKAVVGSGGNPTVALLTLQKQMLEDPGETFRIGGQIALTTTAAAVMYGAVMSGVVVGGGPGRWGKNQGGGVPGQIAWQNQMREEGRVPYSIKVGDASIPFDRFGEPIAIVLRMVADAGMYSSYATYQSQEEWLAGIAGIMGSGLYQASFLQGLNDAMSILTTSDQFTGPRATRAVQNWVSTQTPFGGTLAYVRRLEDPYRHVYGNVPFTDIMRVHEDTYGGIFAKLLDRLPGVGKAPLMIDQFMGEPVPSMPGYGPNGLNPLQMAIPFAPRFGTKAEGPWSEVMQIKGFYMEKRPNKNEVVLTNGEQQKLNGYMASIEIDGKKVREFIRDYARQPAVQEFIKNRAAARSQARTQIIGELDKGINQYFRAALSRLVETNPEVAKRAAFADARKGLLKANDPAGAGEMDRAIAELLRAARGGD